MSETEQQIIISGGLLSITVFEQKLMRNFYVINSRLKKLQSIGDIEHRQRNVEKQLKFLSTKVESMVQKIPKDGNALSKKDVINVCKDQVFDLFNNSQDKLKETELLKVIQEEIDKVKGEIKSTGRSNQIQGFNLNQSAPKPNSFTAGTILLSQSKKSIQPSQQLLNQVLSKQQNKIVNQIISQQDQLNEFQKIKKDIENLYETIDNLKLSLGRQNFISREMSEYEKRQRDDSNLKSQQNGRKRKSPKKNEVNAQNVQRDEELEQTQRLQPKESQKSFNKGNFSLQMERNQSKGRVESNINGKSQIIVKQDLIARKTLNQQQFNQLNQQIKIPNTLLNKDDFSGVFINGNGPSNGSSNEKGVIFSSTHQHFNKIGELNKVEYIPQNKLLQKAQRAKSLKKLQRVQKKLRVDDIKEINTVLKEIQLRLQSKTNNDIFTQFIKEIEEKVEIIRITKDQTNEISDLRKMFYHMDSKLQSIITYLQSIATEDDALIVKKNWTCISCDKMIEKFNGKVGQHLNWDSMQAKKISPTKVGAFGQAGQLVSKIKNLMDHNAGQ